MSGEEAESDSESVEGVAPTADLMIGDPSSTDSSEQMLSPVATKVFELLAPIVDTANVELLDVEWTGGTLRVVLDHPDGVSTESLTSVNRLISPILDQHDPIPGRYTLEVSSPGVERPLRRLEHFRRAVGENIIIKTVASVEPRRFKGALTSVAETAVVLDVTEVDGVEVDEPESRTVPIADISTARTIFDWGPTPKIGPKQGPGQKKSPGQKKGQKKQKSAGHQKPQQQHSQRKAKKSANKSAESSKQPGETKAGEQTQTETQASSPTESAQNRKEVGDE